MKNPACKKIARKNLRGTPSNQKTLGEFLETKPKNLYMGGSVQSSMKLFPSGKNPLKFPLRIPEDLERIPGKIPANMLSHKHRSVRFPKALKTVQKTGPWNPKTFEPCSPLGLWSFATRTLKTIEPWCRGTLCAENPVIICNPYSLFITFLGASIIWPEKLGT